MLERCHIFSVVRESLILRKGGLTPSIPGTLEQNHDNRAPKSFVQGIDFLRKSIPCGFGLGYIYRDFALVPARCGALAGGADIHVRELLVKLLAECLFSVQE